MILKISFLGRVSFYSCRIITKTFTYSRITWKESQLVFIYQVDLKACIWGITFIALIYFLLKTDFLNNYFLSKISISLILLSQGLLYNPDWPRIFYVLGWPQVGPLASGPWVLGLQMSITYLDTNFHLITHSLVMS